MSVWRRSFWKSLWFALLRSREDKRARAAVFGIVLLLVWIVAEDWLVFILPASDGHGAFQTVFNGFVVATGFIAALLLRRANRKQDELLNFSITGRNPRQLPEDVSPEIHRYPGERAVILASLLARAGGEVWLEHHELPPGAEVVTRQVQNTLLRQIGLWEKLEPTEIALVSAADGLWTAAQRMEVITWCEQLRLLRWTLGMDAELMPLAHNPQVDYSLARDLLQGEAAARSGKPIRASWDLRGERDLALEYLARVLAEFKGRSLIADSVELDGWADELREKSLGASVDYLAGSKTIGELSDEPLRLLGLIATHARNTLDTSSIN
jgi:hypothetical protein